MHQILTIPELIDIIFESLIPSSVAACAQVCKSWSDVAFNALWANVDDFQLLISQLVPLTIQHDYYDLARPPTPTDWQLFQRYARCPAPNLFSTLAYTRVSMHILPNLQTLQWLPAQDKNETTLFLHPRLRAITMALPTWAASPSMLQPCNALFDTLSLRAPHVKKLELSVTELERFVVGSGAISTLLRSLRDLEVVVLPDYFIEDIVLSTLAFLPSLRRVRFESSDALKRKNPVSVQARFEPDDAERKGLPFSALRDLALTVPLPALHPLLPHLSKLTQLYVRCPFLAPAYDVVQLFALLPSSCPSLVSLFLELLWMCPGTPLGAPIWPVREPGDELTFDALRPLLTLPMKEFTITCDRPLALSSTDVETIARAWPSIEVLMLACEPPRFALSQDEGEWTDEGAEGGPLGLDVLPTLARLCPQLRTLGLFLDASSISPTIPAWNPSPPLHAASQLHAHAKFSDTKEEGQGMVQPFRRLEKLSVGVSPIVSGSAVALALSHILPAGCVLECQVSWLPKSRDVESNAGGTMGWGQFGGGGMSGGGGWGATAAGPMGASAGGWGALGGGAGLGTAAGAIGVGGGGWGPTGGWGGGGVPLNPIPQLQNTLQTQMQSLLQVQQQIAHTQQHMGNYLPMQQSNATYHSYNAPPMPPMVPSHYHSHGPPTMAPSLIATLQAPPPPILPPPAPNANANPPLNPLNFFLAPLGPTSAQTLAAVSTRSARWAEAAALLPVLCQVRREERERNRIRDAELEDLRARYQVLLVMRGAGDQDDKGRVCAAG
ncbi:hypothetical protein HWV62_5197 [Athelia sp. TMB]|nr:hypothetical protein HWV62_5197 [Athelia sp. TMB]